MDRKNLCKQKIIQITTDAPIKSHLSQLAELEDRTLSNFVNRILKDYVQSHPVPLKRRILPEKT